jgi:hypothetical protein
MMGKVTTNCPLSGWENLSHGEGLDNEGEERKRGAGRDGQKSKWVYLVRRGDRGDGGAAQIIVRPG